MTGNWLQTRGGYLGSPDIGAYLKQWEKARESDGFALRTPSRWKYFRHLLDVSWTYGEIRTPRHRAYSYIQAVAELFLGYDHVHLLDEARLKRKQMAGSFAGESAAAGNKGAVPEKG